MMRFTYYPIARTFTSLAVAALVCLAGTRSLAQEALGGQVVGFQDASGKTLFLHDFKDKAAVINLWAVWCGPCIKEMPSLGKLAQDYKARGLEVITLSEDDNISQAVDFFKKNDLALVPYLDKGHAIYTALGAQGLPTTIIVSKGGQMIQRIEGPVDWQSKPLQDIIEALLK